MFNTPIKYVRFENMEDVVGHSVATPNYIDMPENKFFLRPEVVLYRMPGDDWVFIVAFRPEVPEILNEEGYEWLENPVNQVPLAFKKSRFRKRSYIHTVVPTITEKILEEARQPIISYWCERAKAISKQMGIKDVETKNISNLKITAIWKSVTIDEYTFRPVFSGRGYEVSGTDVTISTIRKTIATYTVIDPKRVVICDEFGCVYLVSSQTTINDFVNALINAGYRDNVAGIIKVKAENHRDVNMKRQCYKFMETLRKNLESSK